MMILLFLLMLSHWYFHWYLSFQFHVLKLKNYNGLLAYKITTANNPWVLVEAIHNCPCDDFMRPIIMQSLLVPKAELSLF